MQATGISGVRGLHAAPGVPPVDICVNGAPAAKDLAYGILSDYFELPHGRQQVETRIAGSEGPALARLEYDIRPGRVDTLVFTGQSPDLQVFAVQDNVWAFSREQARVRLLHASPDAPPLDVAIDQGQALFQGVAYGTATPYRPVEPGAYALEVRDAAGKGLLLSLPEVALAGGTIHTLFVMGLIGGEPALHLMPLLEAIEICTQG